MPDHLAVAAVRRAPAMAVVVFTGATLRFRRDLAPGRPPAGSRAAAVTETVGTADVRGAFGHGALRAAVALDDVTVEVPGGSVVAVVGGDGAGKSTLLRALAGEVSLDAGTVEAPPKQRLGYLPASSGSWAALTVTQNIDFVAGIYGLAGDELTAAPRRAAGPGGAHPRGRPARRAAVRRDAAQARLRHGDRAPAGLADPRRAHHGHRPGEPHRPVAARIRGRGVGRGRAHVDDLPRRGRARRAPRRARQRPGPRPGLIRPGTRGVRRRGHRRPASPSGPTGPGAGGGCCTSTGPAAPTLRRRPPAGTTAVAPDLEDIVIALSLARRNTVPS